jgi:hypothetical protein
MTKKLPKPTAELSAATPTKLASMLTQATEPVDLKSAMVPVTGNSEKIDLSAYKTVTSKNANVFYEIGTLANGLRLSFRLWKEASDIGTTLLGIRLRVGDHPDGESESAKALGELQHLNDKWTTSANTVSHNSILGNIKVNANAWEPASVVKEIIDAQYLSELWKSISTLFPEGAKVCNLQAFTKLFYMLTAIALQDVVPPAKKTSTQNLHFGSAASPILIMQGTDTPKVYAPAGVTVPVAKPASPQPFTAPHPKDSKKAPKASKALQP